MNSAALIAFTNRGLDLGRRIADGLAAKGMRTSLSGPARFADAYGAEAYEDLAQWTAGHFGEDALVFVGATGIAVRALAPHVHDKFSDPAVVSIDEGGHVAVPLLSGHVGAANDLARTIADIAGGQAAISTATDLNGLFAVDEWAARHGLSIVERELAKEISARLLEGGTVGSRVPGNLAADLPDQVKDQTADLGFVVSLDETDTPFQRTLHLAPRIATVGVGCRKGTDSALLKEAADRALTQAGLPLHAVKTIASIDVKRDEPAIAALARAYQCKTRFYSAEELRAVPGVFAESEFVENTVGVGNVCERAALAESGRLVLEKQAGNGVTVAIAVGDHPFATAIADAAFTPIRPERCPEPDSDDVLRGSTITAGPPVQTNNTGTASKGCVTVIGLGPGGARDMTRRAYDALCASDLIVGYTVYVNLLRGEFGDKEMLTTPMRKETERCELALQRASEGEAVALVCSGDPGMYGMAGLLIELARDYPDMDIEVLPGVSAVNGGAAILGAPLMHDCCTISLSDLLTPWDTIECRLRTAAEGDFVIGLYNPASHKRPDHLKRACDILLSAGKSPDTVCGIVRNIGREGQEHTTCTLAELRDAKADMFTTVIVGNSQTHLVAGSMVTPRGYETKSR